MATATRVKEGAGTPPRGPRNHRWIGLALLVITTLVEVAVGVVSNHLDFVPPGIVWLFVALVIILVGLNAARDLQGRTGSAEGGGAPFDARRGPGTSILVGTVLLAVLAAQVALGFLLIRNQNPYGSCTFDAGGPGVQNPYPSMTNEQQLRFCPVQVNGGGPVTGKYTLEGDVLGPLQDRQQSALLA